MSDTDLRLQNLASTDSETLELAPSGDVAKKGIQSEEITDAPLVDMALQSVAEQGSDIGAGVSGDIAALRAEVESLSQRTAEMSENMVVSAKAGLDNTARSVRGIVLQRPLASFGLALTLGFLAGLRAGR